MEKLLINYNLPKINDVKSIKITNNQFKWDEYDLNKIFTHNELLLFKSYISKLNLSEFKSIEEYRLNYNIELSNTFFNSEKLIVLELENVKFSYKSIFNLPKLKHLLLNKVECSSLNSSISNSKELISIKLWNLKFTKLPKEIVSLTKLKELTAYNKIKTINNLTFPNSIEKIDLRSNFIEEIPNSIFNLPKLKTIDLSSNKFSNLPLITNSKISEINLWDTPFGLFKKNIDLLKNLLPNARINTSGNYVEDGKAIYLHSTQKYYSLEHENGTTQNPQGY